MKMNFTDWIKKQHRRNDATGDIARDIRQDRCWPRQTTSLKDFVNHLRNRHRASSAAIGALEKAYREWEALSEAQNTLTRAGE